MQHNELNLFTELRRDDPPMLTPGGLLEKRFAVENLISIGGFGQVFLGHDLYSRRMVAIKTERTSASFPLLQAEAQCLRHANMSQRKIDGFSVEPFVHFWAYGETKDVRFLIMDLCGPNLRELKKVMQNDRFSVLTSLWIMHKLISALRTLHTLGWIHRDVKPANFCITYHATEHGPRLYIIDFGMSRYYRMQDGTLRTRKLTSCFHGTVRYVSLNVHRRKDISRWDDLWSVYYMTAEHILGSLPWRVITDKEQVKNMKEDVGLLEQKLEMEGPTPNSVRKLQSLLQEALENSETSFYECPPYQDILDEIMKDLNERQYGTAECLDWERLPPKLLNRPGMIHNPAPLFASPPYKYNPPAFNAHRNDVERDCEPEAVAVHDEATHQSTRPKCATPHLSGDGDGVVSYNCAERGASVYIKPLGLPKRSQNPAQKSTAESSSEVAHSEYFK